eukprot:1183755-Prorocentrum_minimum.AAC.2
MTLQRGHVLTASGCFKEVDSDPSYPDHWRPVVQVRTHWVGNSAHMNAHTVNCTRIQEVSCKAVGSLPPTNGQNGQQIEGPEAKLQGLTSDTLPDVPDGASLCLHGPHPHQESLIGEKVQIGRASFAHPVTVQLAGRRSRIVFDPRTRYQEQTEKDPSSGRCSLYMWEGVKGSALGQQPEYIISFKLLETVDTSAVQTLVEGWKDTDESALQALYVYFIKECKVGPSSAGNSDTINAVPSLIRQLILRVLPQLYPKYELPD